MAVRVLARRASVNAVVSTRHRTLVIAVLAATACLISAAAADCTCRAFGRNFDLGGTACLATPSGPRLATCVMVLNNTSWQFSDTPCVAADDTDIRVGPGVAAGGGDRRGVAVRSRSPAICKCAPFAS